MTRSGDGRSAGSRPRHGIPMATGALAAAMFAAMVAVPGAQQPGPADASCRLSGRVTGLGTPLPGVSITARRGEAIQSATSTAVDGSYRLPLPGGLYQVRIEMMGFETVEHEVTLSGAGCVQAIDLTLSLAARQATAGGSAAAGEGGTAAAGRGGGRGFDPAMAGRRGGAGGRGFQTLAVAREAGDELLAVGAFDVEDAPLMLPSGFGFDDVTDAIAITGALAQMDRGMMNDRQQALARGDINLALADLAVALGSQEGGFARGLEGGFVGGPGGLGGRLGEVLQQAGIGSLGDLAAMFQEGGFRGRGGGGAGGFTLGGRGGRGSRVNMTADYRFGGSVLESAPYALRGEAREERPYTRQNFGGTIGGPFRIPGLYSNPNNRSNFTLTYNGGRGSNLFDQYATVPSAEMRRGDFSSSPVPLIDPLTGQPFPDNQIPEDRISPQALAMLQYFPTANLEGSTRNYRYMTATESINDSLNVRFTHNFTPLQGRGGAGARGGGGGRGGGRGGPGFTRTNVTLTTNAQIRRSEGEQNNVFSTLGGTNRSTTVGLPVTLNVIRNRMQHSINVNFSRTSSATRNQFSGVTNVAGNAGIQGVSTDPFSWGLPALSFSSITGLRDTTPSRRSDRRFSTEYRLQRPMGRHSMQLGGDVRLDRGSSYQESNANGAFVFTGLYTTGSLSPFRGYDFADFLLGLPQQATLQYGPGDVVLSGRSINLYVMDDWRARPNLTLNLGVRYELLWPYIEGRGQLVNLDVAPDFSGAAPVVAGGEGPFNGAFPDGLVRTDYNNVAPRLGFAWRTWRGTVLRGGYGISYNAGTYNAIARQLASQPPFATTNTQIGSLSSMLLLEHALLGGVPNETTNNYGVDKDYVLGTVQNWNLDVSRNLTAGWAGGATYTHTRGSNLDILRAPNREADGTLRIDGVQPFTWRTAEGSSVLHSATFRLDRRQIRGIGGGVQYTIAQSRDNSPSIGGGGGGGTAIAQNDQDIDSEWGRSNFDQRHRFTARVNAELPFGPNRPWLADGGFAAALLQSWRVQTSFSMDAGSPLTVRVRGAARDVSSGLNGALRADLTGDPLAVSNPTIDQFFNTEAFTVPAPGLYGTSGRNLITGPGSKRLDASFSRDVRMGGNRSVSIQMSVNNLLNMVNYSSVDTWVNSPTFGQVLGVRSMRSATLNLRFRY